MGRTKRSTKQRAQVDRKQEKTSPVESNDTDCCEMKEPDLKKSAHVNRKDCRETAVEKKQPVVEKVETDYSNTSKKKRKLAQAQTPENQSHESKRQRISPSNSSQTSTNKSPVLNKRQNINIATRQQVHSRIQNGSKHGQSTSVNLPSDSKVKKESKAKTRKKLTKTGVVGDTGQLSSPASDSGIAVKKEIKTEIGIALNASKEAKKLVGAHCSIAGGLHNAVEEAVAMGGRAFGLFLKSQRTWASKPLESEAAEKFKAACKEHSFPPNSILPHGSYLLNCGSPNPDTLKKSRESLLDELQRCEALGLTLFNFHPGSTCGEISVEKCLDQIAECINWAHQQTKFVITVVENMSCQGNTVGGRFEELKGIIDRVQDKARIGVCLDTCHAFAAGFDLSTKQGFDKFVSDFDSIVGFQYLKAMHLNDSKGGVGCHLDRHENIGKGQIGLDGFRRVMAEPRFDGIPMILETPLGDYAKEIKILNGLV